MRIFPAVVFALLIAASQVACAETDAPATSNNAALQELMMVDQRERLAIHGKPWTEELTARDLQRREAALKELSSGRVVTATDHYNVALIFQHGLSPDNLRLAYSMAWTAYTMREAGSVPKQEAAWLSAAAWDRLMLYLGKKQWYGTQYERDEKTHTMGNILPFDPEAATAEDKERFLARPY